MTIGFAEIRAGGRDLRIEYAWVGRQAADAPLLVFLHEGLGSRAMWRDFPAMLCDAAGCRGLVYSRPGYGRSTPRRAGERWDPDSMHRSQALDVLPALLQSLGIAEHRRYTLFGHSDGASIALLHAAAFPQRMAALVVLAPHINVEARAIASIEQARVAYETTDLRTRLARWHDDVDSAFRGWNDIWLDPRFRGWSIERDIATIACPVLAVQGVDDEYGTLDQIHGIARIVPQTELLELPACGHSPHRDQPEALVEATLAFLGRHLAGMSSLE